MCRSTSATCASATRAPRAASAAPDRISSSSAVAVAVPVAALPGRHGGPGLLLPGGGGVPIAPAGLGGHPIQLLGAAHLWARPQGLLPGAKALSGIGQLRELRRRDVGRLARRPVRLLGRGERLAGRPVALLRLARQLGATSCRHGGVAAVVAEEALRGSVRLDHRGELVAILLEAAERLGDIGDHGLVERRKGLGEGVRERLLAGALGQLGLAQLHQQVDQGPVALLAEAEQVLVDGPPVIAGLVVHDAAAGDRLDEPLPRERGAGGVDQGEIRPDPLVGDEEPVPGHAAPGHCLHPAADGAELLPAIVVAAAELQPRVAEPLGMRVFPAQQQVPLHALLVIGIGLDAVRRQVAVEQERQQQGEHLRLAGAVVAAQQQPPVVEPELLDVVVEEIDQPRAQRLPPGAPGRGEPHDLRS
jgi:hypothetical protein